MLPRKSALQYLKLNDIVEGSESRENSDEKHQLSSRHLELLANLSSSNEQSLRFWAMCELTNVLASWGHRVNGYLHSCPCHPVRHEKEKQQPSQKRKRKFLEDVMQREDDASCPMAGRMGVALASGYIQVALANLKAAGIPAGAQDCLDGLDDLGSPSAKSLLENFESAKSRLAFRTTQVFGYWSELPWALLMVMRPFVETFSSPEEAGSMGFQLSVQY